MILNLSLSMKTRNAATDLKYFKFICEKCGILPKESMMVGNDVDEDMCADKLGFDTFLITDTIVNRENKDYSHYKNGSFEEFYKFLQKQF